VAGGKADQDAGAAGVGEVGDSAAGRVAGEAAAAPPAEKRRPRSKVASAGKALAKAEALSAAGAQAMAELAVLQRSVGQLVQGLTAMLDTQAAHEELLRAILKAMTAPTDPEERLSDVLGEILARLTEQRDMLRTVRMAVNNVPQGLAATLSEQLASALAGVR